VNQESEWQNVINYAEARAMWRRLWNFWGKL